MTHPDNSSHQAARRLRLKQAAQQAGYPSIDKLTKAILEGEIKMSRNYMNMNWEDVFGPEVGASEIIEAVGDDEDKIAAYLKAAFAEMHPEEEQPTCWIYWARQIINA